MKTSGKHGNCVNRTHCLGVCLPSFTYAGVTVHYVTHCMSVSMLNQSLKTPVDIYHCCELLS